MAGAVAVGVGVAVEVGVGVAVVVAVGGAVNGEVLPTAGVFDTPLAAAAAAAAVVAVGAMTAGSDSLTFSLNM